MTKIVYGSEIAKQLKAEMKLEVDQIRQIAPRVPQLTVVLVGDNPASISYVTGKEKACQEVGIQSRLVHLLETTSQEELEELIEQLNHDENVDGILVQLPLPKHLSEREILLKINPEKDVDGLHPVNVGRLMLQEDGFVPCTPMGIMEMLKQMDVDLNGKNVCVIGRSKLVGNPVAQLLMQANATVTICHSRTKNIEQVTNKADVVVVAMGRPRIVGKSWIKEGAVVIDVGVNRVDGKLCGDVDFDQMIDHASIITPVPKGVGPMTITMLLRNTIKAWGIKSRG